MKTIKQILSGAVATFLSVSSLLVFAPAVVSAASVIWDGEGADNNFTTAANWVGDIVPVNGDTLVFPASVDSDTIADNDRVLNNNIASLSVGFIQVTGTYITSDFDYYKITGNAISLAGGVIGFSGATNSPVMYIEVPLTVTAPSLITNVSSTKGLSIGSNNVTSNGSYFGEGVSGSGQVTIGSNEGGSGKGGGACPTTATPRPFAGDSSGFSGALIVASFGNLSITQRVNDAARFASSITKASAGNLGFRLDNGQDMAFDKAITFNGGTVTADQERTQDCTESAAKTVTLSGNMNFTAETTFSLSRANLKFTGNVTGAQFVKVAAGGTGSLTLPGGSEIKSEVNIITVAAKADCFNYRLFENNKTLVNADCSAEIGTTNFPVEVKGILGGTGSVGPVKVMSGGTLAPGLSPGCLNSGNLSFVAGSTYEFEVGGTDACTGYDQTKVTGTVDLGNGTLKTLLFNGFKPAAGQTYRIIDNDAADAVTGTFAGLVEGATVTVDGYVLKISYIGGDGNDVVLSVQTVPTVPDTGFSVIKANPATTIITSTLAAGVLLVLARRFGKMSSVSFKK